MGHIALDFLLPGGAFTHVHYYTHFETEGDMFVQSSDVHMLLTQNNPILLWSEVILSILHLGAEDDPFPAFRKFSANTKTSMLSPSLDRLCP